MFLKTLPLEEIKPYPNNPRVNDRAVEKTAESITKNGYRARIICDADGVIIVGHTRLKALQRLGWKEAEVWIADDMTPEQAADYRIRDNATAELSEWDYGKLNAEIEKYQLDFSGFDFYQPPEQAKTAAEVSEVEELEPEPEEAVTIRRGDIFALGESFVMCGDATDGGDVDALFAAAGNPQIDLLLTDPPYGVALNMDAKKNPKKRQDDKQVTNDQLTGDELIQLLAKAFTQAEARQKCGGGIYVWYATRRTEQAYAAISSIPTWEIVQQLIWVKQQFVLGRQDYQWRHEPCIYARKSGAPHYFTAARNISTVFDDTPEPERMTKAELAELVTKLYGLPASVIYEDRPMRSPEHPTMKPIRLMARLIENSTKPGWTVYDPFGGSGSTLLAAAQLGRRGITMELAPQYVDVIIRRWEQLTGKEARRVTP